MSNAIVNAAARSDAIVRAARAWIGTPYHHQASVRGVGCDCLGLVRGVWRDVTGRDIAAPPNYSRDWGEASGVETMLEGAGRHLKPIDLASMAPGDVLIFRMRATAIAKHAAVVASAATIIHAMEGAPVSEVALSIWWRRRIAAAFRFPSVPPLERNRRDGTYIASALAESRALKAPMRRGGHRA